MAEMAERLRQTELGSRDLTAGTRELEQRLDERQRDIEKVTCAP